MKSLIVMCALALAASVSYAQTPGAAAPPTNTAPEGTHDVVGTIKTEGPCMKDRELLCPGVAPGKDMHKCMRKNKSKVSKECKAKMEDMKKSFKNIHEACHEDVEKYCSDVKPGKGAVIQCMKGHEDEVSQACKDQLAKVKDKHKNGK
ncbi:cysteine rich repeat-containing protein [Bdellovibrio sp. HCB288]|uniref:cysteine rich repeat-containing protein n=1 Tax=Bdellovibrio sp. HCB288 TaxID=3394355 RepID=UPI0039B41269